MRTTTFAAAIAVFAAALSLAAPVAVDAQTPALTVGTNTPGQTYQQPEYRIDASGFGVEGQEIQAVVESAVRELYAFFPGLQIEPFVVTHGPSPVILYERNERGEVVMVLSVEGPYWAQLAFQFSHEFCHVLCGVGTERTPDFQHIWFEEMICELASLYTMRAMARTWRENPPYRNWQSYSHDLRGYVDDRVNSVSNELLDLVGMGLADFFAKNQARLLSNPYDRELLTAIAASLLPLIEGNPGQWRSVQYLDATERVTKSGSFGVFLEKWHDAVPLRFRSFIRRIAELFGLR